jgi:hypothetical protein
MKLIYTLLALTSSFSNVLGGWFECYNYVGSIDKYPITLSIQIFCRHCSDIKDRKILTVEGIYKYDRINNPIKLKGKIDTTTNNVVIKEFNKNIPVATMNFIFTTDIINGKWISLINNNIRSINLKYLSQITDTFNVYANKIKVYQKADILMFSSTKNRYFVGEYEYNFEGNSDSIDRAIMTRLKIIDKKSNNIIYNIDLSHYYSINLFGNLMTVIYENVKVINNGFSIAEGSGMMGSIINFHYNPNKNEFVIEDN